MIDVTQRDGMAVLTLARPDRGNALSEALVESLIEAVQDCIADAGLHTLVLDAQGRHFCTGFDLGDLPAAAPAGHAAVDGPLLWRFTRIERLLALLWHAPLRTVAVARGRTWGAGADLFAACDLRLAVPDAQWRFPGAGFGLVLGTRRLSTLVGADRALAWVAEGRSIEPELALVSGLASSLVSEPALWPQHLPPLQVDRATYARLKSASRPDHSAQDMAALVDSAITPGLMQRMAAYRQASTARSGAKPS